MSATTKGGSKAWQSLVRFVDSNRSKFKVRPPLVPILYAGKVNGRSIWEVVEARQTSWAAKNLANGRYVMVTDLMKKLPSPIDGYRTLFEFAEKAPGQKDGPTKDEGPDIWDLLSSVWAEQNAKSAFIWKGTILAKHPILTTIELPILLFSGKISDKKAKIIQEIIKGQKLNEDAIDKELARLASQETAVDKAFAKTVKRLHKAVEKRRKAVRLYKLTCRLSKLAQ